MKHIVIIGGGNVFGSWKEFLRDWISHGFYIDFSLRSLFKAQPKRWKANLHADLQEAHLNTASLNDRDVPNYDVLRLKMPRPYNARYSAWKKAFEKVLPTLHGDIILVGHSLGALFLIKYLSEEVFPKKIAATFLVASPYDSDGERKMPYFTLPDSLAFFEKQSPLIYMYHSKDDPVVFYSEFEKLHKLLLNATVRIFEERGHFSQEHFPELVQDIRNLPG